MFPQPLVDFFAANQEVLWFTTLVLGAAKYVFKLVIAAIDTVFIDWARSSFLKRHPEKPLAA